MRNTYFRSVYKARNIVEEYQHFHTEDSDGNIVGIPKIYCSHRDSDIKMKAFDYDDLFG